MKTVTLYFIVFFGAGCATKNVSQESSYSEFRRIAYVCTYNGLTVLMSGDLINLKNICEENKATAREGL